MDENPYRLLKRVKPVTIAPLTDARLADLSRGIGSNIDFPKYADADPGEIRQRQTLCRWLLDNPSVTQHQFFSAPFYNDTLPDNPDAFLRYGQKLDERMTGFWQHTQLFQEAATALYQLPPRIVYLVNALQREGHVKYLEEMKLKDEILYEMRKNVTLRGIVRLGGCLRDGDTFSNNYDPNQQARIIMREPGLKDISCYGTWLHHPAMDPKPDTLPAIVKVLQKCHLRALARMTHSTLGDWKLNRAIKPTQIKRLPLAIAEDIRLYLNGLFSVENGFTMRASFTVDVEYQFDQNGLRIRLLDWEVTWNRISEDRSIFNMDFGRVGKKELMHQCAGAYNKIKTSRNRKDDDAFMNQWFMKHSEYRNINAYNATLRFGNARFNDIIARFQQRIDQIKRWQEDVLKAYDDLRVIQKMVVATQKSKVPYCFPDIVDGDSVCEIDHCYPVRVRTSDRALHPFRQLSVNGQIVNLTGRNGSGKSTCMLALFDLYMLAQNGLPVFARSARLAPRSQFLLSFLDRSSDQSTFKAKLEKDMYVVQVLKKITPEERRGTLVIIDELGSATDQVDVLRVAKPYVSWLSHQGVGVMMSTQIFELSEYIETVCNGLNLIIKPDFSLEKGIGTGEPYEVAKEMGFFELIT